MMSILNYFKHTTAKEEKVDNEKVTRSKWKFMQGCSKVSYSCSQWKNQVTIKRKSVVRIPLAWGQLNIIMNQLQYILSILFAYKNGTNKCKIFYVEDVQLQHRLFDSYNMRIMLVSRLSSTWSSMLTSIHMVPSLTVKSYISALLHYTVTWITLLIGRF